MIWLTWRQMRAQTLWTAGLVAAVAAYLLLLAGDIREEMARTRDLVLAVAGHPRMLDCRPELQQAVELRNPYVDALSFLQLRFLDGRGRAERLVQATVNGVAAGLRNTG